MKIAFIPPLNTIVEIGTKTLGNGWLQWCSLDYPTMRKSLSLLISANKILTLTPDIQKIAEDILSAHYSGKIEFVDPVDMLIAKTDEPDYTFSFDVYHEMINPIVNQCEYAVICKWYHGKSLEANYFDKDSKCVRLVVGPELKPYRSKVIL